MSGSDTGSGGAGVSGAGLQSLLSKFQNSPQAASFSADGSAPSQFTMPGGGIPQYQGTAMMPATLGGAAGVQDAQDYSQMVQDQSGMSAANMAQLAQKLGAGAGNLSAGDAGGGGGAGGGMRAGGGGGGAQNFTPTQLQGTPTLPGQGNINLAGAANASPSASVQNLLQLLKLGNTGFSLK